MTLSALLPLCSLLRFLRSLFGPVPSPARLIRRTTDPRELGRIATLLAADIPGSFDEVRDRARCRAVLAAHRECPLPVLALLTRDPDTRVRRIAAKNLYDPAPSAARASALLPRFSPRFAH